VRGNVAGAGRLKCHAAVQRTNGRLYSGATMMRTMKNATVGHVLLTLLLMVAATICFGVGPGGHAEMFTLFGLVFIGLAILPIWRVCRSHRDG
jgi:hypothetical protein